MNAKKISLSFNYVTVHKVRRILKSLKNKTSTSADQLDNRAVKLAADFIASCHHTVNNTAKVSQVLENFQNSSFKQKKNSPLKVENYRPVSTLSPLSKILEKVVYEQIYRNFEKNSLFLEALHGYRKNRSTMTALICMYDKWVKAASEGNVSGVVLADLSAAFDLVPPDLLVKKLKIYGLKDEVISWLNSYLTNRYQMVWIDHTCSDLLENSTGVPQG